MTIRRCPLAFLLNSRCVAREIWVRARLSPGKALRSMCRLAMRSTIFGVRYRYVAVVFPDGSFFNVVEGPNDTPGALAWWSRVLDVTAEE